MIIYTFQPETIVDTVIRNGIEIVIPTRTCLYRRYPDLTKPDAFVVWTAYIWMASKLAEKIGLWYKDFRVQDRNVPGDKVGDYIDRYCKKKAQLPFWGWYKTDGGFDKPGTDYCLSGTEDMAWGKEEGQMCLLTLDIPDHLVLLSDANAWYCAFTGRPCYEYESPEEEERLNRLYKNKHRAMMEETDPVRKEELRSSLEKEIIGSWDNILRTEGRRLRELHVLFYTEMEKEDVQAVFPFIHRDWIVCVDYL